LIFQAKNHSLEKSRNGEQYSGTRKKENEGKNK